MPASVAHLITPQKVFELALRGASHDQIAASIGICRTSYFAYLKADPAIRTAFEKGRANDVLDVVSSLKTMATEKNNAVAAIFYLKNRDPDNWKDKHDVEHNGNLTINVAQNFGMDMQEKCINPEGEGGEE